MRATWSSTDEDTTIRTQSKRHEGVFSAPQAAHNTGFLGWHWSLQGERVTGSGREEAHLSRRCGTDGTSQAMGLRDQGRAALKMGEDTHWGRKN